MAVIAAAIALPAGTPLSEVRAAEICEGAAGPAAARLVIRVMGVQPVAGEVAVTVYPDSRRRFLAAGGKLLRVRTAAEAPATSACFWLPPGAYAVAVYHDANGNQDYDRTRLGMPLEGFAFSNDPPTRFGLPSFETTRFALAPGGTALDVRMRYVRGEANR
jgi:uncharacterized protein (DUF2141 family)